MWHYDISVRRLQRSKRDSRLSTIEFDVIDYRTSCAELEGLARQHRRPDTIRSLPDAGPLHWLPPTRRGRGGRPGARTRWLSWRSPPRGARRNSSSHPAPANAKSTLTADQKNGTVRMFATRDELWIIFRRLSWCSFQRRAINSKMYPLMLNRRKL